VFELTLPPEDAVVDVAAKISHFFSVEAEGSQMFWGAWIMLQPVQLEHLRHNRGALAGRDRRRGDTASEVIRLRSPKYGGNM
jgi:hypothetical protein